MPVRTTGVFLKGHCPCSSVSIFRNQDTSLIRTLLLDPILSAAPSIVSTLDTNCFKHQVVVEFEQSLWCFTRRLLISTLFLPTDLTVILTSPKLAQNTTVRCRSNKCKMMRILEHRIPPDYPLTYHHKYTAALVLAQLALVVPAVYQWSHLVELAQCHFIRTLALR